MVTDGPQEPASLFIPSTTQPVPVKTRGRWRRRSSGRRWFAAGSAAALAAAVGIAVAVQSSHPDNCALPSAQQLHAAPVALHEAGPARRSGPGAGLAAAAGSISTTKQSGKATFYGPASPGGNCSYPQPPANKLTAAAGPAQYAAAGGCGSYVDITGPRGTARVKIDNQCPECAKGHFDLSNEAFAKIGDPSKGIVPITYKAVRNPTLSSTLSFRVKEGSSQWWFALLVDGAGNPLRTVEVSSGGSSWKSLQRTDYNYWLASSGAGKGPFKVRVTDVYGQKATVSGIKLSPTKVQKTSARLYGSGVRSASSDARSDAKPTATKPGRKSAVSPTSAARPTASPSPAARSAARTAPLGQSGVAVPTVSVGQVPVLSSPTPVPDRCAARGEQRS